MKKLMIALSLLLGPVSGAEAGAALSQGFVETAPNVRIHYLVAGPDDADHILLLIPGWRQSSSIWTKQFDYFAARNYQIIAIDSRSQGGSSIVQSGNAPEDRAGDIQQVMSKLHLTNVTLVGWSQGVQDVAAYVGRFGTAAVDALVLVDSPLSYGPETATEAPEFTKVVLKRLAMYSREPAAYSKGLLHAQITAPTTADTYRHLAAESMKTPSDIGISMLVQDLFTVDRRPILKKFDKPTLIIASSKSTLLDAQRRMAAAIDDGRIAVIANASHAVFFDQPGQFNQILDEFVSYDCHGVAKKCFL